jgi:hypothetical protein
VSYIARAVRDPVLRRPAPHRAGPPAGAAADGPTCRYPGARSFALLPGRLLPFAGSGRSGFLSARTTLLRPDPDIRDHPDPVQVFGLTYAYVYLSRQNIRRSARWPRRCRARRLPHRSAHYVATTAGDRGQPAGVPGCRPSMTGTARPGEVWPQRMSGSDERAAIPGSET